ncbi:MAG: bifunctional tRNA (5-methylaminomethyl-2-thiouridine)(34)-methyltransferase MnmD/FAD-dependent 5-carboxymethylaminomethyl-2-thiouridine(34) oxidoreductase MnmC [Rugosibacter sp.]|nr:bifunctional tRNA (5-methylaminomethyl-2-thiouridine)(34)-methyltransferase MnmD/FAD-dependent 5-carboxymethylaminomethyl-2-thiouridine(34) oxidoreductase MnmC [Rugosibacter sp.]
MSAAPLVPAELAATGEGTPFSPLYDDVYHAAAGGLAQARQVFLGGNDLPARWLGAEHFTIGETGFGLGLNFLATWQAWQAAGAPCRLDYVALEKHPFRRDNLARALARFPELGAPAAELVSCWPPLIPGFHRLHFAGGRLTLTLLFGDAPHLLPQLVACFDALYLDGFAPAKNPEMWSAALLSALTRRCHDGTTLATWSVAGDLRRTLEHLGWTLERRPGFGGKREMLVASRPLAVSPSATARRAFFARPPCSAVASPAPTFPAPGAGERKAIVIGAGLAGAAISERLASRGWRVELFERNPAPAQEASGNPAGILLPLLTKDDALAGRLSRACYLYALRRLAGLPGVRWSPCGVLQIARDDAHEDLQRATIDGQHLPTEFAAFLARDAAATLVGRPLAQGGWWFPGGGWVAPASFCIALLAAAGEHVRAHYGVAVTRITRAAGSWQAFAADGKLLAEAPHLILANAQAASALLPHPIPLTLTPIRGQISYLPPAAIGVPALRHVLCRNGYLTPPDAGTACLGASFDRDDQDIAMRSADHRGNLQRLEELLPGILAGTAASIDAGQLEGRVGIRTATRDRLPLVGALPAPMTAEQASRLTLATLPREKGLHVLLGLGARGMVWAPLLAELLASQMADEPLPLECGLADAVDPARFELRALRRNSK